LSAAKLVEGWHGRTCWCARKPLWLGQGFYNWGMSSPAALEGAFPMASLAWPAACVPVQAWPDAPVVAAAVAVNPLQAPA
jgi:hypothetical protein